MQVRLISMALILLLLVGGIARAEEAVIVEIADTRLSLPNSALHQDRHYLGAEGALLTRIGVVLADMDCLLAALHALPPELTGSLAAQPIDLSELAELVELALNNNPELAPFRSKLASQAAQTRLAGAKPDPMVMLNVANLPLPQFELMDTPMTQIVFGWSQQYESYGKRNLKREIASLNEDLTLLDLGERELSLIGEITQLYFELAATRSQLTVLDDHAILLELLLELAERKYALGRTPQAQVISGQVQLSKLSERRIALSSLLSTQEELLKGLTGHAPGFDPAELSLQLAFAIPQEVSYDEDALLADTLRLHPVFQRLNVAENQAELGIDLAQKSYQPDYTLNASYGLRWGKRDFFAAGVSFPLSTNKADRQDARLQESYAQLDMVAGNREQFENTLTTRIRTINVELTRLTELSALYREALIPQALLALDSNIAAYAANQVELAELLRAAQLLLTYELELEQQAIDYLASLAELQVVTAGAFDPTPYLAPDLSTTGTATAGIEAELNGEIAAAALDEVRSALSTPDATLPGSTEDFIPALRLPANTTEPLELQPVRDAPAENPDPDEFYEPFEQSNADEESDDD